MNRIVLSVGLIAAVAAWGPARAAADELADVEKLVAEKNKEIRSARFKIKTVTEMVTEGFESRGQSEGNVEYVLKDGKWYSRAESKDRSEQKMGDQSNKMEGTSLSVCDGEFIWMMSDMNGQKSVTKSKATSDPIVVENPIGMMREQHNLKLMPEESVDGAACYVIEATSKQQGEMAGKMVQYFRKADGFTVKVVSFSPDGKPMMTMSCTDIELNPKIDPDRFKFEPPAGVQVMDLTQQAAEPQGEPEQP